MNVHFLLTGCAIKFSGFADIKVNNKNPLEELCSVYACLKK